MKERGFMPFSAAGALVVIVVLGMVAQASFSRHQRSLDTISDISISSLQAMAAGVCGDLQLAVKYATYRALWEVCKDADLHDNGVSAIGLLATRYFLEHLSGLISGYSSRDARIEVVVCDEARRPLIEISDAGNGYVTARASLPAGSKIRLTSWDDKTSLAIPFENIEVFVDSRYFLLEQKMNEFVEGRGKIIRSWRTMEYSQALVALFLTGRVELVRSRSKTSFEAAWASHELDIFGSSDYWATAQGLAGESVGAEILSDLFDGTEGLFGISMSRENLYGLLPPVPIRPSPGISVYHEFNIKRVSYRREDPAGLLGLPTATPIPIGSTGAAIWWGQWEITVEMDDVPVEKIFDFDNPTIPLLYGNFYVHEPLAYRWKIPEKRFVTTVTVFSPKPFTIFTK